MLTCVNIHIYTPSIIKNITMARPKFKDFFVTEIKEGFGLIVKVNPKLTPETLANALFLDRPMPPEPRRKGKR